LSDIVERLNNANLDGTGSIKIDMLCVEAADEIVRLRAERDEQRSLANGRMAALIAAEEERAAAEAERNRLRAEQDNLRDLYEHLNGIAEAAEAERDRLRDALERVLENTHFNNSADLLTPLDILRIKIRAALKEDTL